MSALFIKGFERAPIPGPIGFTLGTLLDPTARKNIVSDWAAAGALIGNHSFSHLDLNEVSLATYESDVSDAQKLIDQIVGASAPRFYRFPYLHEGETLEKMHSFYDWLAANGYRAVPPTINFLDYLFEEAYRRCLAQNDSASITQLEELFLQGASDHFEQAVGFADQLFDREVPHILLLHMVPFTAKMFRKLILTYKGLGVEFISAETALEDDIYQEPAELVDLNGMPLLERLLEIQNGPSRNELTETLFASVQAICPE